VSETKAEAWQQRPATAALAFDLAVARRRAGRPDEAELLYHAVLKIEPELHFLKRGLEFRGAARERQRS